ncbi:hypothetical protein AGDE_14917 [Angomonas deanei]|nr:hypothetical protein AGDE_14917 [Angomonas deanei]|eukprot:EPY20003.1 hypothetical protein AGDE_14917 [Angomonas deanei]
MVSVLSGVCGREEWCDWFPGVVVRDMGGPTEATSSDTTLSRLVLLSDSLSRPLDEWRCFLGLPFLNAAPVLLALD